MAEPENHTLALLRKLDGRFDDMNKRFDRVEARINDGFEHLSDNVDRIGQLVAGEIVRATATARDFAREIDEIKKRLAALEGA